MSLTVLLLSNIQLIIGVMNTVQILILIMLMIIHVQHVMMTVLPVLDQEKMIVLFSYVVKLSYFNRCSVLLIVLIQ